MADSHGMSKAQEAAYLERGRLLFARECVFMRGVVSLDGLPEAGPSEVAFAGRSNVGKSSLINTLTRRRTLARTSNTPGRTQELNYFELGQGGAERLWLVDLPGYGFAQAPKEQVAAWTELIFAFCRGRQTLRRVCLLIDARHGLKAVDFPAMDLLDNAAVNYQVVLTKIDKITPDATARVFGETTSALSRRPAAHPTVLVTSSHTGTGLEELRASLASLATPA